MDPHADPRTRPEPPEDRATVRDWLADAIGIVCIVFLVWAAFFVAHVLEGPL